MVSGYGASAPVVRTPGKRSEPARVSLTVLTVTPSLGPTAAPDSEGGGDHHREANDETDDLP